MTNARINQAQSALLDATRYLLASVVVLGHGFGFFLNYFDGFIPGIFPHPQSIAVVCFFYLSGYLIVGSQLKAKSDITLYNYLFNRATRIYVTLIPSLTFVVLSDFLISRIMGRPVDLVAHYANIDIFFHNFFLIPSMPYGTMRPIWSLMYEWWIYVLFGGLFFLYKNFIVSLILLSVGSYYTIFVNGQGEAGPIWLIWAFGGLCIFLQDKIKWEAVRNSMLNIISTLLFLAAMLIYYNSKDAYNIYAGIIISLSLFVFFNSTNDFHKVLVARNLSLRKLAGFSFTLFLIHYTVLIYVKEFFGFDGWGGLIFGFILSNIVAFSIALVTEFHLKSIKLFLIKIFLWRKFLDVK